MDGKKRVASEAYGEIARTFPNFPDKPLCRAIRNQTGECYEHSQQGRERRPGKSLRAHISGMILRNAARYVRSVGEVFLLFFSETDARARSSDAGGVRGRCRVVLN